jgi:hypothetical protein
LSHLSYASIAGDAVDFSGAKDVSGWMRCRHCDSKLYRW